MGPSLRAALLAPQISQVCLPTPHSAHPSLATPPTHPAAHLPGAVSGRRAQGGAAQVAKHRSIAGTGGDQRQQVECQQVVERKGALEGAAGEGLAAVGARPRREAVQGEHRRRHGCGACTTGAAEDLARGPGTRARREPGPWSPRSLPSLRAQWFFSGRTRRPERDGEREGAQGTRTCPPTPHPVCSRAALTHPDAQAD